MLSQGEGLQKSLLELLQTHHNWVCAWAKLFTLCTWAPMLVCKEVYIQLCLFLFVHKHAFVCDSVVSKARCSGFKQLENYILTDRPPARERRPSERQRGGGKHGREKGDTREKRGEEGCRGKETKNGEKTNNLCLCCIMIVSECNVTNSRPVGLTF